MTYNSEVMADTPLALYRLGEASGTTMNDSGGSARNGTYGGSPTFGTASQVGDANTAVTLNGTSQFGTVTSAAWMSVGSHTLEGVYVPSSVSGIRTIVSRRNNSTATTIAYALRFNGTKAEFVVRIGTTTNTLTGATTLLVSTKYHVAATYDNSTGVATIYVNGVADGTATWTTGSIANTGVDLHIGRGYNSGEFAAGILDEVAVYGTALSAARITAHAGQVPGIVPTSRVSREHIEVLVENDPDARVSREHIEVLNYPDPDARISREHIEVLHETSPDIRVHVDRTEILVSQIPQPILVHAHRTEILVSNDQLAQLAGKVPPLTGTLSVFNGRPITLSGTVSPLTGSLQVSSAAGPEMREYAAHDKAALMLDGSPQKEGHAHAKVAESQPGNLEESSAHAKLAEVGVADVRISSGHIKTAKSEPGDLSEASAHLKIGESEPGRLGNYQEHAKVADRKPYPVDVGSGTAKVAMFGVDKLESASVHVKTAEVDSSSRRESHAHVKVLADILLRQQDAAAHVKVLARASKDYRDGHSHVKVGVPFSTRRKKGWGVLL